MPNEGQTICSNIDMSPTYVNPSFITSTISFIVNEPTGKKTGNN